MYDDYEYEPNYPEVEEIIEEAQNKFGDYLKSLYKEQYDFLEERAEELIKRECEVRQREANVSKRETVLKEDFKNRQFSSLGLDWKLNDTAYTYIIAPPECITCPTCKGKKKVNVTINDNGENLEVTCPTCDGCGKIREKYEEYSICGHKVIQIDYSVYALMNGVTDKVSVTRCTEESSTAFKTYLTLDNNIRFSPENVFHSIEECEKAAKEEIKKKNETLING